MKNLSNINEFNFLNSELINKIKSEAKNKFKKNDFYHDCYIVKNYIKHLGELPDDVYNNKYFIQIINFIAEKWTDVERFINMNELSEIEDLQHSKNIRPLLKVNDHNNIITLPELIKLHGKKKILELCNNRKEGQRIIWRSGKMI